MKKDEGIKNMNIRVGGKYKLIKKCGKGAFGEIYEGQNSETG